MPKTPHDTGLTIYMVLEDQVFLSVAINSDWLIINERMNMIMEDDYITMRGLEDLDSSISISPV